MTTETFPVTVKPVSNLFWINLFIIFIMMDVWIKIDHFK